MKDPSTIADRKPTADFIAAAQEQGVDVTVPHENGMSWMMDTLSNHDLDARYSSMAWLLDQGARPWTPDSEGRTALHVLFGQVERRIDDDTRISRRLIDLGSDVNAVSSQGGLVFCEVLWMKHTDEELQPIYDLWFEQPGPLDFTTPATNGREPLGMTRPLPHRKSILERLERYVAKHS